MAQGEFKVIVEGTVLSTVTEAPAGKKVYPKVSLRKGGRMNGVVECRADMLDEIKKLKPGQVVQFECYSQAEQVPTEINGNQYNFWREVIGNAKSVRVLA